GRPSPPRPTPRPPPMPCTTPFRSLDGAMAAEAAESERARSGEAALLNGPALPGHGLDQADVDVVMGPAEAAIPAKPIEPPAAGPAPAGTQPEPGDAAAAYARLWLK